MIKNRDAVAVVVPIYKRQFEPLEQFSIDYSLAQIDRRPTRFVAPESLDVSYYAGRYPATRVERFPDEYFTSIEAYSRLLLREDFYRRFAAHEFMLLLQPDAILLRDELDFWTAQPFDYIGAPWPEPMELTVRRDHFKDALARRVRATVGNGGFSLRRVGRCIGLIREFPEMNALFIANGTNEDGFFSLLGTLSADFLIPNEVVASRFAIELKPEYYFAVNGGRYPMGVHAWGIVQPTFWAPCIPPLAQVLRQGNQAA